MEPEALNVILLMIVVCCSGVGFCLSQSPESLERVGRRLRARGRALTASRKAYAMEYQRSLDEDARSWDARQMFEELKAAEQTQEVE